MQLVLITTFTSVVVLATPTYRPFYIQVYANAKGKTSRVLHVNRLLPLGLYTTRTSFTKLYEYTEVPGKQ